MSGLSTTGFEVKRLTDIVASLQTRAKAQFGNDVNLDADSVLGQHIAIIAAEIADVWEGAGGAYSAAYPSSATGISLDYVGDYVAISRLAERKTSASLKMTGDVGSIVKVGSLVAQAGSGIRYATSTALTLSSAAFNEVVVVVGTLANSTAYSITIGGIVCTYTSDASATATEILDGLVAAITGTTTATAVNVADVLTITAPGITEETLSVGAGLTINSISRIVLVEAVDVGPNTAEADTITVQVTPLSGITAITNPSPATVGRFEETDTEFRQRRYESVQIIGAGTAEAIRAKLRQLSTVTTASVIENTSDSTDVDGRPPHSFECIVAGGTDAEIAATIWETKPAGIQTYGSVPVVIYDSEGDPHTMNFSRPTSVYIHVQIVYTVNSEETFPATGEAGIAAAVLAYGTPLQIGQDIITQRFMGPIYTAVPGISTLDIQLATSPDGITPGAFSAANVVLGRYEQPLFAANRISVSL